jgi:glucuronate isomerase
MTGAAALIPHPDRLFPADPGTRAIARRLFANVESVPIISPHGHLDAAMLAADEPLGDPTALLITSDHYVTRLLHASGVPLSDLGVRNGPLPEADSRRAWRLLCGHWDVFRGTPVRYWLECELAGIFGVTVRPSARTADTIYDQLVGELAKDSYRPRALVSRFGVEVLATTEDPLSDLGAHAMLAADPSFGCRVVPSFRPDRFLELSRPGWVTSIDRLGAATGEDVGDYDGFLRALEVRRRHFVAHGATSADHSHADARTDPLGLADARRIYQRARRGEASPEESVAFRRNMIFEMARMSVEDGLVRYTGTTIGPPMSGSAPTPGTTFRWRPSTPTRSARCWKSSAPSRAFAWSCSALTRPCSPGKSLRWRASTLLCTRALRGGSSTRPMRSAGSGRLSLKPPGSAVRLASSTTRGRCAPFPPGMTCPAASTAVTSPGSSPSTGWTRMRRPRCSRTW